MKKVPSVVNHPLPWIYVHPYTVFFAVSNAVALLCSGSVMKWITVEPACKSH